MKKDEFNIYEFHQSLTKNIEPLIKETCIEHKISSTEDLLKNSITYTEEVKYIQEIQELKQKHQLSNAYEVFNNLVYPILDEYKELLNCTIKDSFIKKKNNVSLQILTKKKELVDQYIKNISSFSVLSIYLPSLHDDTKNGIQQCDECNIELDIYENTYICPICSCEKPYFQDELVSFKDLSRINTNIKYSYIRQTHFKDTMKQFQGKQNKYIDDYVYKTLVSCFENIGLGTKNNTGHYNKITKDHIKMFLQENNLCKYYEDMNLIYSELTGKPCPTISNYEKLLMEDFEKLLSVYDKVIKEDESNYSRSSFLNSYYVLFQLLKKNGNNCKESDFPIIKTIDRKIEHDEIYEKCCKILGWSFYSTV